MTGSASISYMTKVESSQVGPNVIRTKVPQSENSALGGRDRETQWLEEIRLSRKNFVNECHLLANTRQE